MVSLGIKAYTPPDIRIYDYDATEDEYSLLVKICSRRSTRGRISDWFREVATNACKFIGLHGRLPDVIFTDLSDEQREKVYKYAKNNNYKSNNAYISALIKDSIDKLK